MSALPARITQAGLAAAWTATRTGVDVQISHLVLGRGRLQAGVRRGYDPSGQETALANEAIRIPVASGEQLDATTIRLQALLAPPLPVGVQPFWAQELGLLLSDGTLFAVHSSSEAPITWVSGSEQLVFALSLGLVELPQGSVTWLAGGATVNLFMSAAFAGMASALLLTQAAVLQANAAAASAQIARLTA
jgi:hypothetical protein